MKSYEKKCTLGKCSFNPNPTEMNRRRFLKQSAWAIPALAIPEWILADPYRPLPLQTKPVSPVRIRGVVQSGGKGVPWVAVTDGVSVVTTDAKGVFTLVSTSNRSFVYISTPASYKIPQNTTGTARFYRPIQPNAKGEMDVVFTLQPDETNQDRHRFLALGDVQTQNKYETARFLNETVPDMQQTLRASSAAFGVAVGDIMFDDLTLYPDYEAGVQQMGIPFFQVMGNHDLDFDGFTDESTRTFTRHFGPTYYSFNRGAVHYVVLEDVMWVKSGYLGYIHQEQLAWLEQDLALVEKGRPVVLFWHIPGLSTQYARDGESRPNIANCVTNREAIYRLLKPYQAHLISGHTHEHEHVYEGGVHEHILATVCGAWWSGDICSDGAPNGYAVFEANGESLSWRYKATGKPDDHQIRLYKAGSEPNAPDEFVANVWDWNPDWQVVWYEDGIRKGHMSRRLGYDPLAVEQMLGNQKPTRRTWAEPNRTHHLFYAPTPAPSVNVTVEATDPFGKTYSQAFRTQ